ncbi:hypothetical protein PPERSA_12174 [Pseudocohnilembus persalinus]|uniref:Uncharacterized protein n=1 Tax=Pseudocohnilembus persalinus TaxID=266149 RepID=A0A0V0R8Q8_PSEPJ|nr:hypothetical protein PPERSA_12174 [Pseudocohnilembus persalinus]|eukprot:KRX10892.1 hypothetical protein PPERSA_12174 [Pseudocohnilembus persalinus]
MKTFDISYQPQSTELYKVKLSKIFANQYKQVEQKQQRGEKFIQLCDYKNGIGSNNELKQFVYNDALQKNFQNDTTLSLSSFDSIEGQDFQKEQKVQKKNILELLKKNSSNSINQREIEGNQSNRKNISINKSASQNIRIRSITQGGKSQVLNNNRSQNSSQNLLLKCNQETGKNNINVKNFQKQTHKKVSQLRSASRLKELDKFQLEVILQYQVKKIEFIRLMLGQ